MIDLDKEIEYYFRIINDTMNYFNIYKQTLKALHEHKTKANQVTSFLYPMLDALQFAFVVETTRLIDKREDKCIWNLLDNIKMQYKKFPKEIYNDYSNPESGEVYREFVRKVDIKLDISNFEKELNQYSTQFESLKGIRDKVYAHLDKKYFYDKRKISKKYSVCYQDIEDILKIIHKNLNIISIDYNRKAYSEYASCVDDLNSILDKI